MMTKKDFERMARELAYTRPDNPGTERRVGWFSACVAVAGACRAVNPRFDTGRFLEACETYKGQP